MAAVSGLRRTAFVGIARLIRASHTHTISDRRRRAARRIRRIRQMVSDIDSRSLFYTSMDSPIGELLLLGDGHTLCGLYMQDGRKPARIAPQWEESAAPFTAVQ